MTLTYICRHCRSFIGSIESGAASEMQLGFHFLTPEERKDIISYDSNGDVTVKVVCDYCKQTLDSYPELSLLANPLQ
jgi:Protein of unknown function (DUF2757).